ncbi:MerR family transcriptional regulator [Paenibacillus sp. AR247]|uniref:MerR family transcriptional regulator n=1 Tax=Paenibacillus sp. AR247 TaxID=1631599 RepID=UPI00280BDB5A|nr:MerR family transcriptional regulator [Paenibacillus sp. AR247]
MENQYTIQQLSQKTGLSVHTLRYYERIGLLEGVPRDEHGYRLYRESDLLWVEFLMRLRGTGMPISEMKRFSDLRSEGDSTITERREMLRPTRRTFMSKCGCSGIICEVLTIKSIITKVWKRKKPGGATPSAVR